MVKRLITLLSVMLVAVACVLFGCGGDKYAGLKVDIKPTVADNVCWQDDAGAIGSNGASIPLYDVVINEPVDVTATLSGMSGISQAINLSVNDEAAFDYPLSTASGSMVTITGKKPSYNNSYFILKAASAESSTKFAEIALKVIVPVTGIAFQNVNLAVSKMFPLSLTDYLSFSPNSPFLTNQTGVSYSIINNPDPANIGFTDKADINPTAVSATGDNNSVLTVLNDYTGPLTIQATSTDATSLAPATIVVNVIQDIDTSTATINGTQIAYNSMYNKTTADLFSNSPVYSNETYSISIDTTQSINIRASINGVSIPDGANTVKNSPITLSAGSTVYSSISATQTFTASAITGLGGTAEVAYTVDVAGFNNRISYDIPVATSFNVSALASTISVTQDGTLLGDNNSITLYNDYASALGSKFMFSAGAASNVPVDSRNKFVVLSFNIGGGQDQSQFFSVVNSSGSSYYQDAINAFVVPADGNTPVYIKALSKSINATYNFEVSAIVGPASVGGYPGYYINLADGSSSAAVSTLSVDGTAVGYYAATKDGNPAPNTTDTPASLNFSARCAVGADTITTNFDTSDTDYKIILQYYGGTSPTTKNMGLLTLTLTSNTGLVPDTQGIIVAADSSFVTVAYLSSDVFGTYATATYQLLGKKAGSTAITITTGNGHTLTKNVQIVQPTTDVTLGVDSPYTSSVITDVTSFTNGQYHQNISAVSAKTGTGSFFQIYINAYPGSDSVKSSEYSTANSKIAAVNATTGLVQTGSVGVTTVTVITYYYSFTLTDNYLQCTTQTFTNHFDLTVFIPLGVVTLPSAASVYDSNSLGYNNQGPSYVDITAQISNSTATALGCTNYIKYEYLSSSAGSYLVPAWTANVNGSVASGTLGKFQAFLPAGTNSMTVILKVTVYDLGTMAQNDDGTWSINQQTDTNTRIYYCTVTIVKAVQTASISITNINTADANHNPLLSVRVGQPAEIDALVQPANVFNNNLVEVFGSFNETTGQFAAFFNENTINDYIAYTCDKNQNNYTYHITTIKAYTGGLLAVRLYAADSMTGPTQGKVYTTVIIDISDGSILNPYSISNEQELKEISTSPASNYVLTRDINLSEVFVPIQDFSGTLNGYYPASLATHKITGLQITKSVNGYAGLFANILPTGGVFNLQIDVSNISLTDAVYAGAIAGVNQGYIINCAVNLRAFTVSANSYNAQMYIGGMVGQNEGCIADFANYNVNYVLAGDGNNYGDEGPLATVNMLSRGSNIADYDDPIIQATDYNNINNFLFSNNGYINTTARASLSNNNATLADFVNFIKGNTVSLNPVSGTINVKDNGIGAAYVGGIAGSNNGKINGIYNLYSTQAENPGGAFTADDNIHFVAAFASEGVDASVNINPNTTGSTQCSLVNAGSAVGGAVGYNTGSIYNVSANGSISANVSEQGVITGARTPSGVTNNAGGIAGYASGGLIYNTLSSEVISAKNYVGGIVGYASDASITLARAECYQANPTFLTASGQYAGGVVGYLDNSILNYAYSAQFVNGANNNIIYTGGANAYVGGVIGAALNGSTLSSVFAKININAAGANVGGLAGYLDSSTLTYAYFIGTLTGAAADSVVAAGNYSASDIYTVSDTVSTLANAADNIVAVLAGNALSGFAADSNIWFSAGNTPVDYAAEYNSGYPVLKYNRPDTYVTPSSSVENFPLISKVPSSITVTADKTDNSTYFSMDGILVLTYSPYGTGAINSRNHISNNYQLTDILSVSVSPADISLVNILVNYTSNNLITVNGDGSITANGTGEGYLNFTAQLNSSATAQIHVMVIPYVSTVKLFGTLNYYSDTSGDYLTGGTLNMRVNVPMQVYPVLYDGNNIVYDNGSLKNYGDYGSSNPASISFDYSLPDVFTVYSNMLTGSLEGPYDNGHGNSLSLSVTADIYVGGSWASIALFNDKTFAVNVYAGATNITVTPNSDTDGSTSAAGDNPAAVVISAYMPQSITADVTSDVSGVETLYVSDIWLQTADGWASLLSGSVWSTIPGQGTAKYSASDVPFSISDGSTDGITGGQLSLAKPKTALNDWTFDYIISLKSAYQFVASPSVYRIVLRATSNIVSLDPDAGSVFAEFTVSIIPQVLISQPDIQHFMSDNSSMVAGFNVPGTGGVPSAINSIFTFSNAATDEIIPGEYGLLTINTYPSTASIASIAITSSSVNGQTVTMSQLAYNNAGGGFYYLPLAGNVTNAYGSGIMLSRASYYAPGGTVDGGYYPYDKDASYNGSKYIDYCNNDTVQNVQYSSIGGGIYAFNGNLYLQTITPSGVVDGTVFTITLLITYTDGTIFMCSSQLIVKSYVNIDLTASTPVKTSINSVEISAAGSDDVIITAGLMGQISPSQIVWSATLQRGEGDNSILYSLNTGTGADSGGVWDMFSSAAQKNVAVNKANITLLLDDKGNATPDKLQPGDIIKVAASIRYMVNGMSYNKTYEVTINVVDIVIAGVSVVGLNSDGVLQFSVSGTQTLQASFTVNPTSGPTPADAAYGDPTAITALIANISQGLSTNGGAINYWWGLNASGGYNRLDDGGLTSSLPFTVNKSYLTPTSAVVSLTGGTQTGSVPMQLQFEYYYMRDGSFETCQPNSIPPEAWIQGQPVGNDFDAESVILTDPDSPIPITSAGDQNNKDHDLLYMIAGENYILKNDLHIHMTDDNFTPINTAIGSLDGNNCVIYFDSGTKFSVPAPTNTSNTTSNINLGLFDTVSANTVLKNLVVAYPDNMGTDNVLGLNNYSNINFGGLAAVNNGLIYNCDVISYDPGGNTITYDSQGNPDYSSAGSKALLNHIDNTFNISTSTGPLGTNNITAFIGGLVGTNSSTGVITNSRVGRSEVDKVQVLDDVGARVNVEPVPSVVPVFVIRVVGWASVGGFVGSNSGVISSSYFANGQIVNVGFGIINGEIKTAGFAAVNSGSIYTSYAAGFEEEDFSLGGKYLIGENGLDSTITPTGNSDQNRKLGGGLYSGGYVAGFVYENSGTIENSYSNINLSGDTTFAATRSQILAYSQLGSEYGNVIGGGFVMSNLNSGYIAECYSMSSIKGSVTSAGPFTGMDSMSSVQNSGTIENCYYFANQGEAFNSADEPAQILTDNPDINITTDEGGSVNVTMNEFINEQCFAGFSFDAADQYAQNYFGYNTIAGGAGSGGVWAIYHIPNTDNSTGYPQLISANNIAISVRIPKQTAGAGTDNPYEYLYVQGYSQGSVNNPYIIYNADQYVSLFNNVYNSSQTLNATAKFTGNVRVINNIDFSNLTNLYSQNIEYRSADANNISVFDGNNMAFNNIVLINDAPASGDVTNAAYGLFKVLNGVGFKNLTLMINSVTDTSSAAVGALAGIIVNSNVANINIYGASGVNGPQVNAHSFAGALAGIVVSGDPTKSYTISNINADVNVKAVALFTDVNSSILGPGELWDDIAPLAGSNLQLDSLITAANQHRYSYAGGIAGLIDLLQYSNVDGGWTQLSGLSQVNAEALTVAPSVPKVINGIGFNYSNTVGINGEFAGGLAGFMGQQTHLKDSHFEIGQAQDSHHIYGGMAAGGLAGINYGEIEQSFVSSSASYLATAEDTSIAGYTAGNSGAAWGNAQLFDDLLGDISSVAIGGLVGINIANDSVLGSGSTLNSYSRANVRNAHATYVGGIAGETFGGIYTNVYATGSLMGALSDPLTTIGGIVGLILTPASNLNPYSDTPVTQIITFINCVALNLYSADDYGAYTNSNFYFTDTGAKDGVPLTDADFSITPSQGAYITALAGPQLRVGALYGCNISNVQYLSDKDHVYVSGDYNFIEPYMYSGFGVVESTSNEHSLFIGVSQTSSISTVNENVVLNGIARSEVIDLWTANSKSVTQTAAKMRIFNEGVWSPTIWAFDVTVPLPYLKYGYMPAVVYIYDAQDWYDKVVTNSGAKYYCIMNDIDFSGVTFANSNSGGECIQVTRPFSGFMFGQKVFETPNDSTSRYRYPILYNIDMLEYGSATTAFGIFDKTSGASLADLTFAISGYDNTFNKDKAPDFAASGILIGDASGTSVYNVNIYSQLTTDVTQNTCTKAFLELYDVSDPNNHLSKYFDWTNDDGGLKGYVLRGTVDAKGNYTLAPTGAEYNTPVYNLGNTTDKPALYDADKDDAVNTSANSSASVITVYANMFGAIMGRGLSSSTITKCVVRMDIIATPKTCGNYPDAIGGIAGDFEGGSSMTGCQFYGSINVPNIYDATQPTQPTQPKYMNIGGIAGLFSGSASSLTYNAISISNATVFDGVLAYNQGVTGHLTSGITVGSSVETTEKPVQALVGINIGGIFGSGSGGDILQVNNANITVYANTTQPSAEGVCVGGIAGQNSGMLSNSTYAATVADRSAIYVRNDYWSAYVGSITYVGGAVGYSTGSVSSITTSADIKVIGCPGKAVSTTQYSTYAGGIAGFVNWYAEFSNLLAHGSSMDITGAYAYAGGIVGEANSTLRLYYAVSTYTIVVNDSSTSVTAGGLIGQAGVTGQVSALYLANAVSLGNITVNSGNTVYIGGIIGSIYSSFYDDVKDIAVPASATASMLSYSGLCTAATFGIGAAVGYNDASVNPNLNVFSSLYYCEADSMIYSNGCGTEAASVYDKNPMATVNYPSIKDNNGYPIPEMVLGTIISNIILDRNVTAVNPKSNGLSNLPSLIDNIYTNGYYTALTGVLLNADSIKTAPALNYKQGTGLDPYTINTLTSVSSGTDALHPNYYVMTDNIQNGGNFMLPENVHLNTNGYTIYDRTSNPTASNVVVPGSDPDSDYYNTAPVFGSIGTGSSVVGLLLMNVNITSADGTNGVGAIALLNNGTLFNCGVTGTVATGADDEAGLVGTNNGLILSSFARVTITDALHSASGLAVHNNGGIASSFSTSTLQTNSGNSTATLSGLVYDNAGNIADCYTDANMLNTSTSAYSNIYSIVCVNGGTSLVYNTYYDINAFVGGVSNTSGVYGVKTGIFTDLNNTPNVGLGYLRGDWSRDYYPDGTPVYPDANGKAIKYVAYLYLNSSLYTEGILDTWIWTSGTSGDLQSAGLLMSDNWFNLGYGLVDLDGYLFRPESKTKLLDMLYTGNGRAKQGMPEYGKATNCFANEPFKITNIGVFELFVIEDNITQTKHYYQLQNDISGAAYTNGTFKDDNTWSNAWDGLSPVYSGADISSPVSFYGDFDGNGETVKDIYDSRYGLFRALRSGSEVYDFTLSNSNSRTAMLAGFMEDGAYAHDITVQNCNVVNSNNAQSSTHADYYGIDAATGAKYFNDKYFTTSSSAYPIPIANSGNIVGIIIVTGTNYDNGKQNLGTAISPINFNTPVSAGLIAYMTGGTIQDCNLAGTVKVTSQTYTSQSGSSSSGIAAGLVGIVNSVYTASSYNVNYSYVYDASGNSVEPSTEYNVVYHTYDSIGGGSVGKLAINYTSGTYIYDTATAVAITGKDVSGLVGTADYIELNNLDLESGITLNGLNSAAGIVNAVTPVGGADMTASAVVKNVTVGSGIKFNTASSYAGGIVGLVQGKNASDAQAASAEITNCTNNADITVTYSSGSGASAYLGGIGNDTLVGTFVCVGGIVGYMQSGTITSCTNNGGVTASNRTTTEVIAAAGGMVGFIFSIKASYDVQLDKYVQKIDNAASTLTDCYNSGNIGSVGSASASGGLAGYMCSGTIGVDSNDTHSTALAGFGTYYIVNEEGTVSANYAAGGVVGIMLGGSISGNIANNGGVNLNYVNLTTPGEGAGGIAGTVGYNGTANKLYNDITLTNLANTGNAICATGYSAGGIVGYAQSYIYIDTTVVPNPAPVNYTVDIEYCINLGSLGLNVANITKYLGGIAGQVNSAVNLDVFNAVQGVNAVIIRNCTNEGGLSFANYAGGIVGTETYNPTGFTALDENQMAVLTSCQNYGTVTNGIINNQNGAYAGGIAGSVSSFIKITNCQNYGDIGTTDGGYNTTSAGAGGIVGQSSSIIIGDKADSNSGVSNKGHVYGVTYSGGIIGNSSGAALAYAVNTGIIGPVSGTGGGDAGGLVGYEGGDLTISSNSTNNDSGVVTGSTSAGGLVGKFNSPAGTLTIDIDITNVSGTINLIGTSLANTGAGGLVGAINSALAVQIGQKTSSSTTPQITVKATVSSSTSAGGVIGYINLTTFATSAIPILNLDNITVDSSAKITNMSTSTSAGVGGIIGYASGIYSSSLANIQIGKNGDNVTNNAVISGGQYAGGIVGYGSAIEIYNAANNGNVISNNSLSGVAGGIAGYLSTMSNGVVNDYTILKGGSITNGSAVYGSNISGGIVGQIDSGTIGGTVSNSGQIGNNIGISTYSNYAGGIIGVMTSGSGNISGNITLNTAITNSGAVFGSSAAGGIVGNISDTITNSSNPLSVNINSGTNSGVVTGAPSSGGSSGNAGGIVGGITATGQFGNVTISSVTNTANVTSGNNAGGIVGYADGVSSDSNTYNISISGSVTVGSVGASGSGTTAGGVVGSATGTSINVSYSVGSSGNVGSSGYSYAGGIVGQASYVSTSGSFTGGNITASGYAGGIAGQASTTIIKTGCSVTAGTIGGTGCGNAGGAVGSLTLSQSSDYQSVNIKVSTKIQGTTAGGAIGALTGQSPSISLNLNFIIVATIDGNDSSNNSGTIGGAIGSSSISVSGNGTLTCPTLQNAKTIGGAVGTISASNGSMTNITVSGFGGSSGLTVANGQIAGGIAGNITAYTFSMTSCKTIGGNITGVSSFGGIFGSFPNGGTLDLETVENGCIVTGTGGTAGGFCSSVTLGNNSKINTCTNDNVNVSASTDAGGGNVNAGGFFGIIKGGVSANCTNNGIITATASSNYAIAGGFAGTCSAGGSINCIGSGTATANILVASSFSFFDNVPFDNTPYPAHYVYYNGYQFPIYEGVGPLPGVPVAGGVVGDLNQSQSSGSIAEISGSGTANVYSVGSSGKLTGLFVGIAGYSTGSGSNIDWSKIAEGTVGGAIIGTVVPIPLIGTLTGAFIGFLAGLGDALSNTYTGAGLAYLIFLQGTMIGFDETHTYIGYPWGYVGIANAEGCVGSYSVNKIKDIWTDQWSYVNDDFINGGRGLKVVVKDMSNGNISVV